MKKKKGILINWETGEPVIKNGGFVISETNTPIPPAKWEHDVNETIKNIFSALESTDLENPLRSDFINQAKKHITEFRDEIRDETENHNFELAKELYTTVQPLKDENENLTNTVLQLAKNNKPKAQPQPAPKNKNYSLGCDYSANKIKTDLLPIFNQVFECMETDVINFLSENITTQITVKQGFKLKDIIYFIDWLKDKNHIQNRLYSKVITDTKCIVWNSKPITANQIKDTRKQLKKELAPVQIDRILSN